MLAFVTSLFGSHFGAMGAGLAALVAVVIGFFGIKKQAKATGVSEGRIEQKNADDVVINKQNADVAQKNEQIVDTVEKVNETHDRLESDPAYAQRVRKRFTRPE